MQLNNIILSSKEKDSSAVYEVAFSYGLYQLDWDDLHRALLRKSSDGLIGKEDRAMRHRCIYCSRQIFRVALSLDFFFVVYVVSLLQKLQQY